MWLSHLKTGAENVDSGGPLSAEFSYNPENKNSLTASWKPWLTGSGVFD